MVKVEKKKNVVKLILTDKGQRQALRYRISDLKIIKPSRWDGLWRLVMFDVPEHWHSRRDLVRNKLIKLGFLLVQKSVYIHPYPCTEAIDVLREHYKLAPGQLYIFESKVLEGEATLRKHFKL
jgi:phenylacetic acid degradation operon negative regulatory protein